MGTPRGRQCKLPAMRIFGIAVLLVVAACGGGQQRSSGGGGAQKMAPRMDLHCTPQTNFDQAECAASGKDCHYGPPLICRGVDVPDEQKELERQEYESGRLPCECACEEDRVRCSMVP